MKTLSLSALFFLAVIPTVLASPTLIGRASVIDGDTIEIHGQRIRLHGIDAPEGKQTCTKDGKTYRCGQQAAWALDNLLKNKTVQCHQKDTDRYGRVVAECFTGSTNVNASMVQQGWALSYLEYSNQYLPQQDIAQQNKNGMWAGSFKNPWDYRKTPTPSELEESKGCLIKGNINAKGKKIYHLPGNSTYGKTLINEDKGERWFCSEADARKAGWRPVSP